MTTIKDSKLHLIWIVPKYPLPATDGAKHASSVLIRSLSDIGTQIDLIVLDDLHSVRDIKNDSERLGVHSIVCVKRESTSGSRILRAFKGVLRSLFKSGLPITMQPYALRELSEAIQNQIILSKSKEKKVDAVVYDGLHCAAHLFSSFTASKVSWRQEDLLLPIIYRAHNIESDIWLGKVHREKNIFKRTLYKWQARLVREFEHSFVKDLVSGICAVSDEDRSYLQRIDSTLAVETVPIGFDFPKNIPLRDVKQGNFLFVGKLDWPPNREGLEWLLENVWPKVIERNKNAQLTIVGHGERAYLERYCKLHGVVIKGFVKSLADEYQEAQASIAPLFYGSGTRVKIVESVKFGCPVISTELGAQGLQLANDKTYIQAENIDQWVSALTKTSRDRFLEISKEAFLHLKAYSDAKIVGEKKRVFLEQILC